MNRHAVAAALLLAGCSWSNSLYQARLLSRDAMRAEHDQRPGEAQSAWSTVVTKAESAYARNPRGERGAEALWLAGHAEVRTNQCVRAIPSLQNSLLARPDAPWRQQLLLELGQCNEAMGGPTASSMYDMLLATTTDPAVRHEARLRQGHVLVLRGDWVPGAAVLAGEDTLPARLDRATAFAHMGLADSALAALTPALASGDTTVHWLPYIESIAANNSPMADSLLGRLFAFRTATEAQRSEWLLAGARAAIPFDRTAAIHRLERLDHRPAGRAVTEGRMLRWQLAITGAASLPVMRTLVDSLRAQGEIPEGSLEAVHLGDMANRAQALVHRSDSTRAGAPRGDLTMFVLAEFARDSIGAALVGDWCFARIERDWPESPYVPKSLMARAELRPDSAAVFLARALAHADNPYILAASGDRAGQLRRLRLEDSLATFARTAHLTVAGVTSVPR